MLSEKDSKPSERYLFSQCYFSDKAINELKENIRGMYKEREKDEFFLRFDSWQRQQKEILIYTSYAYADIDIPRKFDCLFELQNPENKYVGKCEITQAVLNAWAPINQMCHGHKHLCVMNFENGIPELIKILNKVEDLSTYDWRQKSLLGICDQKDFPFIKEHRLKNGSL